MDRLITGICMHSFRGAILLISVLCGLAPGVSHAGPHAAFSTGKLDFGTVRQGEVPEESITITNEGDAPLKIGGVRSSCPCVHVELAASQTSLSIAPGGTEIVLVRYDTAGYYGERAAMIMIETDDPEKPLASIDIEIDIVALVLTNPEQQFNWSMAPRGDEVGGELLYHAGDGSNAIELIEISMEEPTMTVEAGSEETSKGNRIRAKFRVGPDVPLGTLTNRVTARVRVSGEETSITLPVKGEVVGDVLVMPQSIVCAPRLAYERDQPLSESGIIVRASRPEDPLPEVLGVIAVGPLHAVVHKNVTPRGGSTADRHIIEVRTAKTVPSGAQGGTLHVMTTSKDQPIVSIPVFFRMGAQCVPDPAQVLLEPTGGEEAMRRVVLRDSGGAPFSIRDVKFEEDLLSVEIEQPEAPAAGTPPVLIFRAKSVPSPERMATIVAVVTDLPAEAQVLIPVLIRSPNEKENLALAPQ